ncbi:MAG: hypothetical protein ACOCRO_04045 [Halanaerobiales bacterium]
MKALKVKFDNNNATYFKSNTCIYIVSSIFQLREFSSFTDNIESVVSIHDINMWDINPSILLGA